MAKPQPQAKKPPEIDTVVGYVAAYLRTDGKLGFVRDDPEGSSFSEDMPRPTTAKRASQDVVGIQGHMRTYFGKEKVMFDTAQVLEVRLRTASAVLVEKAVQKELLEKVGQLLSPDEIAALKEIYANDSRE